MKTLRILGVLILSFLGRVAFAQEVPADIIAAIKSDDATKLATLINKDNINNCYSENGHGYSVLSQTVRLNAKKCFDWMLANGADVNKACNGYVPPLMHAAKYGRLEMVKALITKGADVNYKYTGDYAPAKDQTPLTYAQANNQQAVVDYLKSLKK